MAKILKTWGIPYQFGNPDMPHSMDYQCLECGWNYYATVDHYDNVVGCHMLSVPEYGVLEGIKRVIMIIECPNCFSKFWIHMMQNTAKFIMENSTNWPED